MLDRLTKEEFTQFCLSHRDLRIERNSSGQLIIMPPASTEIGFLNNILPYQLGNRNYRTHLGRVGDSSTKRVAAPPPAALVPRGNERRLRGPEGGRAGRHRLHQRIPTRDELPAHVAACVAQRNATQATVHGQFILDKARRQLSRHYPTFRVATSPH